MNREFALSPAALAVNILAVWRVAHLLWGEDGPFDIFVRLRRLAGNTFAGRLRDCFYCVSMWAACPFAWSLGTSWSERFVLWFGLSGGAILLQRFTSQQAPSRPFWTESDQADPAHAYKEESENVVLR